MSHIYCTAIPHGWTQRDVSYCFTFPSPAFVFLIILIQHARAARPLVFGHVVNEVCIFSPSSPGVESRSIAQVLRGIIILILVVTLTPACPHSSLHLLHEQATGNEQVLITIMTQLPLIRCKCRGMANLRPTACSISPHGRQRWLSRCGSNVPEQL